MDDGDLIAAWPLTDPVLRLVLAQDWVWTNRHHPAIGEDRSWEELARGLAAVPPEHARYFLTARERRQAHGFPCAVLWAIKEAAWKALAIGDDVPLAALELDLNGRGTLCGVWLRGEWRAAIATLMSPWPGYLVAAVWVSEES